VLALLLLAPAWGLDPACPFGVNAHLAQDAELELAAAAGIGWVRMDLNWWSVETSRGSYDWSQIDRFVETADGLGLNVFATVAYTPAWAAGVSCDDAAGEEESWCRNKPPADSAYWTEFLTAAVGRYGDRVKHWGMWNEPNLLGFFDGTREQYVDTLLVPGSDAVHDACADCYVVGPELANLRDSANWDVDEGTCVFGECIFNAWEYSLTEILKDAGGAIDIVAHHRYEGSASETLYGLTDGDYLLGVQYMHGLKEITDSYAPGTPVWITEFGYETTPGGDFSFSQAATELELTYDGMQDLTAGLYTGGSTNQPWPELEAMFWYDLTDDPNTYDWGVFTWGLLESDYTPKDAWYTYQELIARYGGCETWGDEGDADTGADSVDTGVGDTDAPRQDTDGGAGDSSGDGGEGDSDGGSDEGGGSPDADTGLGDTGAPAAAAKGCACTSAAPGRGGWLPAALLLLLGLRRDRKLKLL
jgi:MYXO-CTERM domain-containing protein